MILRVFRFRVQKKKERGLIAFMRREALALLKRIPACRAAYFMRDPSTLRLRSGQASLRAGADRKGHYVWVTLWTSDAARRAAMRRKDWKAIVRREEKGFFAGKPQARHYRVLLRK